MDEDAACTEGWGISGVFAHCLSLSLLQLEAYILVSGLPASALTSGLVSPCSARSGLHPLPALWVDPCPLSASQSWDLVHSGSQGPPWDRPSMRLSVSL